jgi:hypothetical protein
MSYGGVQSGWRLSNVNAGVKMMMNQVLVYALFSPFQKGHLISNGSPEPLQGTFI